MSLCLITRTEPGASATANNLRARGHDPVLVCAALTEAVAHRIETEGVQALLMTSAAAARLAKADAQARTLPVYAVGDATAEAASAAGFETVISAGGDGATLAVLAADTMKASDGALLHLRGQEVAGDVTGMLTACGFLTRAVEVYRTLDHPDFKANLVGAITGQGGIVVIHSPAGARRIAHALNKPIADIDFGRWGVVGLSPACLAPLADLGFAQMEAAEQPDEMALLEAVDACNVKSGV